jgi:hypothetical protein
MIGLRTDVNSPRGRLSPAIAAWIAHVLFWSLLLYGWAIGSLNPKGLDIALVFVIFKGDVRLT